MTVIANHPRMMGTESLLIIRAKNGRPVHWLLARWFLMRPQPGNV
jgi:hypothetical protein